MRCFPGVMVAVLLVGWRATVSWGQVAAERPALLVSPVAPVRFETRGGVYFADFGSDAFGNLQVTFPGDVRAAKVTIRLGEKLGADGRIDRKPPGSVNYCEVVLMAQPGLCRTRIPLKKGAQSGPNAVKEAAGIGNVTPFRYAEIEGSPVALDAGVVRQLCVHTAFDDGASAFTSSDPTLNAVWLLCKHTMKATTAFGVYIDGERERRPYEADAYINFLSHMACDFNPEVGRYTIEYLLAHPTWPTEWSLHMPMLVAAEYEATGDAALASRNYDALKGKLMMEKAREDGLLRASAIVDWPAGERDGYNGGVADPEQKQEVGPMINTVANAFYFRALKEMAVLARALRKEEDARTFDAKAAQVCERVNAILFDTKRGLYIDGEGSGHSSLHANMFPLAFGMVPAAREKRVTDFVQSRGMACSVYGAQYLLEALYKAGRDDAALQLLTSRGERSWWNMIAAGSTMTMEAWDMKLKPNATWNHSWGAAPANIIARYLVGVRPLTPGYGKILIAPRPGTLESFEGKVPTARGPVNVDFQKARGRYEIGVPEAIAARVSLPRATFTGRQVLMDKKMAASSEDGDELTFEDVGPGRHVFRQE